MSPVPLDRLTSLPCALHPSGQTLLVATVSDAETARLALETARDAELGAWLWSPPDAADWLGPLLFDEIIRHAHQACPEPSCFPVLDCGNSAGAVLAALRSHIPGICFSGPVDIHTRLEAIARAQNILLHRHRPDLSAPPARI